VVAAGIQCGYHGPVFDAAGACVMVPGDHTVPHGACVRSYPVIQKNQFVWIWMGEAQNIAGNPQAAMPLVEQARILNPHYPPI
jgi:phenylpropionate dioxygenase-like ring-hydroxylating dioxygenase large terminal subunit